MEQTFAAAQSRVSVQGPDTHRLARCRKSALAFKKPCKKVLKDLSDKERQAVDVLTKGILNKLLHSPMSYLRSDDQDGTKADVAQIEALFGLVDGEEKGRGRR